MVDIDKEDLKCEGEEGNNLPEINSKKQRQQKSQNEAKQYFNEVYQRLKKYTASDVYFFANLNEVIGISKYLPPSIDFITYPRKAALLSIIERIMEFQNTHELVDYHPNYNDLNDTLKEKVDATMKAPFYYKDSKSMSKKIKSSQRTPRIRNILHQSLQPYHESYCTLNGQEEIIELIWERNYRHFDQWGKKYADSSSQFLWLPAQFVYSPEENVYRINGKLFHPLEECPDMPELKEEVSQLLTYFAPALKATHAHFSQLNYRLDYEDDENVPDLPDQNETVSFDEKIHAIVKITEMMIEPHSTYTGQWHVEGYSSDNILYTCLYVIEQDAQLVEGKLKFKRASRKDDAPLSEGEFQDQYAHSYCPNYETLCDAHQMIPLGYLDIQENLMIVFPNQNIHKVRGITNNTDMPLKRKIIALFVVNHEAQPLTVNDVNYTKPLSFIKEQRLLDMYERSKNKQTQTQSFNYCEH